MTDLEANLENAPQTLGELNKLIQNGIDKEYDGGESDESLKLHLSRIDYRYLTIEDLRSLREQFLSEHNNEPDAFIKSDLQSIISSLGTAIENKEIILEKEQERMERMKKMESLKKKVDRIIGAHQ